jgi:hypothetical protein
MDYILPLVHRLWSQIFKEHQVSCQKRMISNYICFSSLLHSKSYGNSNQSLVFHFQAHHIERVKNNNSSSSSSSSRSNDHYNFLFYFLISSTDHYTYDNTNQLYYIIVESQESVA